MRGGKNMSTSVNIIVLSPMEEFITWLDADKAEIVETFKIDLIV